MRISGAAYRKVPAVRADEKWSAMVARPTSATFAVPSAVSRMLLVFTSLHAAADLLKSDDCGAQNQTSATSRGAWIQRVVSSQCGSDQLFELPSHGCFQRHS